MRLGRLDLIRYGRFTDLSLAFPVRTPDLHIVFGPNEAGKSTALSAIEDLLFTIPHNSPLNFLHDYSSLRVGAVLEKEGESLEIRRRKGSKETLLTRDDNPVITGETILGPYLAGADRPFFSRMFSLDNERLRLGGKEILEAQDEVGQMLFSAGSGLSGLRDILRALEEEADALWSSRKAAKRTYYQADDRREEAERDLRAHLITPTKWLEVKNLHDTAQDAYDNLEREIEKKTSEKRKLDRIRRSYRNVRGIEEIDRELSALGDIPPFPEETLETLLAAERKEETAMAEVRILTEQLETARRKLSELTFDETLLHYEEDLQKLHEKRIRVRDEKASLPNRETELAAANGQFLLLASGLGWKGQEVGALIDNIPPRDKTIEARRLLTNRGTLLSAVEAARQTLGESEEELRTLSRSMESLGTSADLSILAAVVKNAHDQGDLSTQIRTTKAELEAALEELKRLAGSTIPPPDAAILPGKILPPRDMVQAHRDTVRDLERKQQEILERIRSVRQDLNRQRKAYERLVHDEERIAPEVLGQARQHRDAGWTLIRQIYIEHLSVPPDVVRNFTKEGEELIEPYEAAVGKADELADLRVEKAETAARLVVMVRQIQDQEETLQGLENEKSALDKDSQSHDDEWKRMWSGLPSDPLAPDVMLEWLGTRKEWLGVLERKSEIERRLAVLLRQEDETRQSVLSGIGSAGIDLSALSDLTLSVLLKRADAILSENDQIQEQKQKLEAEILQARTQISRKKSSLEKAEKAWSDWEEQWSAAVTDLGLDPRSSPETVTGQVDSIEEMRTVAVQINELRHRRIGTIQRDCEAFDKEVQKILPILAPDLTSLDAEEAVLRLEKRLDDAKRLNESKQEKDASILALDQEIGTFETSLNEARETISTLKSLAGVVEEISELKTAISKSDRSSSLQEEKKRLLRVLTEEGDGLPVPDLLAECEGVDLDLISAREGSVSQDLDALRKQLLEARDRRTETRSAFESVGGDDTAAKAEAKRQEALAEMKEIAARYTHVRASAILLKWAIDRYRREKQAPLLKTASSLFALLTGNSFVSLRIDFDDQDRPQLVGLRTDGSTVHVSGLSTGTADQLYLALRVASVLEYLDRAPALPFIADDLFINFDDERATAGFKVLSQLAEKTQVIFFTHHRHLVDIAKGSRGSSTSVISL
ncbi:YhaN family protein [Leptospirillum ferriphilum]|uniref:YhaN family protein n=1 Tax=Leptospirillum ferriphilum TaxID=178606 RepID=UPI0006B1C318|nr:YhaN family protein [Leptospirillum ferriphilum]